MIETDILQLTRNLKIFYERISQNETQKKPDSHILKYPNQLYEAMRQKH